MNDIVGAEVVVVVQDVVVADLRADKHVVPHVVFEAAANVHQEVVVAREIVATELAGAIRQIEAGALPTDAAEEINSDPFSYPRGILGVKVRDDGAIGLSGGGVSPLARPPGGLPVEANAPVEDDVGADAGIKAALFRTGEGGCVARSRRHERAEAEHSISLLGLGQTGHEE